LIEAEQVIADMAGIEFDPQVAKLLLTLVAEERRQREAEIELQQQQAAVWNVPPQFYTPQFEMHSSGEAEEELPPDSIPTAEAVLSDNASADETSEESAETPTAAAAYKPVPTFAEAEPDEADNLAVPESVGNAAVGNPAVGNEAANEIPAVETTPLDQMPTMEMPVVEPPNETKPQPEQIQNTEAEPEKESGAIESVPKIQN
ncbi:MAG: hypothetical protein AAB401_17025, partial [Acidobacteriota bacterium]